MGPPKHSPGTSRAAILGTTKDSRIPKPSFTPGVPSDHHPWDFQKPQNPLNLTPLGPPESHIYLWGTQWAQRGPLPYPEH